MQESAASRGSLDHVTGRIAIPRESVTLWLTNTGDGLAFAGGAGLNPLAMSPMGRAIRPSDWL